MDILEDVHAQLDLTGSDGRQVEQLLDYDIVLRLNDDETGYAGFEIIYYPTEEIVHYEEFKDAES